MIDTIKTIEKEKIIVIVRGISREKLIPLANAMYRGGIRLIECTYDASGKISDGEIASNIEMLAKTFDGKMTVGAGTVLTKNQVELTKAAGGRFIISPDTNPEIISFTKKIGLVSIPGALTPTEASTAYRAGADFVKLFPVNLMGAKYVKDLKAPLSHIRFLAVGGINSDNMREYLDAGAVGFGVGSGIVDKKMIEAGNFDAVERFAREYTEKIKD